MRDGQVGGQGGSWRFGDHQSLTVGARPWTPQAQFGPNPQGPARRQTAQDNKGHSYPQQHYRCTTCPRTFAATIGTPFYRLHKDPSVFVCVVTSLAHGCPIPAIVAAFDLDERTVAAWQDKAGHHSRAVPHHCLHASVADLQPVQADEIGGKAVGGRGWRAMALAVPYRLWLGGVVSPVRDLRLIPHRVDRVQRAWRPGRTLRIGVAGLASDVTAFGRAFREKVHPGRRGRPPSRLPGASSRARWSRSTGDGV